MKTKLWQQFLEPHEDEEEEEGELEEIQATENLEQKNAETDSEQ